MCVSTLERGTARPLKIGENPNRMRQRQNNGMLGDGQVGQVDTLKLTPSPGWRGAEGDGRREVPPLPAGLLLLYYSPA